MKCARCDHGIFFVSTEYGQWFAVCESCGNEYELAPGGTFQLVRAPGLEEQNPAGSEVPLSCDVVATKGKQSRQCKMRYLHEGDHEFDWGPTAVAEKPPISTIDFHRFPSKKLM